MVRHVGAQAVAMLTFCFDDVVGVSDVLDGQSQGWVTFQRQQSQYRLEDRFWEVLASCVVHP